MAILTSLYTHIIHTYISDVMHQIVAGSGWNNIDLALLSTGINDEYTKGFGFPQTQCQSVQHYL